MTKICNKCLREKPLTKQYFYKRKDSKDGFRNECKECRKNKSANYRQENKEIILEKERKSRQENKERYSEYNRKWYQKNKKHHKKYRRKYYEENKEQILKTNKKYRLENRDEILEQKRQWYQDNKEDARANTREWYKENKEKRANYNKIYSRKNADIVNSISQRYRARKNNLPSTLKSEEWQQIKEDFNFKCAYCGMTEEEHLMEFDERLHQEHFIPVSRGGGYTQRNIIPSCKSCNSSKGDKDFVKWYKGHEGYSKDRENSILEYLGGGSCE